MHRQHPVHTTRSNSDIKITIIGVPRSAYFPIAMLSQLSVAFDLSQHTTPECNVTITRTLNLEVTFWAASPIPILPEPRAAQPIAQSPMQCF